MNTQPKIKVAIGMSGGVDSSVAAALLKEQGFDVIGIFMKFWSDPTYTGDLKATNKCCSVESLMDARRVATILGIDLITLNVTERFKDLIVDNFLEMYEDGKTPNPCVVCNQMIKVGFFLKKARELGCEYVATGHYAKVRKNADGTSDLMNAVDTKKDQTYFLYRLDQDTVSHLMFPLSDMTKDVVREKAKAIGLPVHKKKDSLEISFVPDADHNDFLKRWIKMEPGDVIDVADGEVVGTHNGLALYTTGQRKGVNATKTKKVGPWYVVTKDAKKNQLIVTNNYLYPGLFYTTTIIESLNWINGEPKENHIYTTKARYLQKYVTCTAKKLSNEEWEITFTEPQRAVTSGQSLVLYDEGVVIGGGIIK